MKNEAQWIETQDIVKETIDERLWAVGNVALNAQIVLIMVKRVNWPNFLQYSMFWNAWGHSLPLLAGNDAHLLHLAIWSHMARLPPLLVRGIQDV